MRIFDVEVGVMEMPGGWWVVVQEGWERFRLAECTTRGEAMEVARRVSGSLVEETANWRKELTPGQDRLFGLWNYAVRPSRGEVIEDRKKRVAKSVRRRVRSP